MSHALIVVHYLTWDPFERSSVFSLVFHSQIGKQIPGLNFCTASVARNVLQLNLYLREETLTRKLAEKDKQKLAEKVEQKLAAKDKPELEWTDKPELTKKEEEKDPRSSVMFRCTWPPGSSSRHAMIKMLSDVDVEHLGIAVDKAFDIVNNRGGV